MKINIFLLITALIISICKVDAQKIINLPKPNFGRVTTTVMEAYAKRHSTREFAAKTLSEQDLSDLLWAAQGQNREDGKLTSPTAMNKQEVLLYVFCDKGVCLYDPHKNTLTIVAEGDHRDLVAGRQASVKSAPVMLLMVADLDKFGMPGDHAKLMTCVDVGIVCQSINLFCSAAGLATVPRASMEQKAISELLGLTENQIPLMNNPVGYPAK